MIKTTVIYWSTFLISLFFCKKYEKKDEKKLTKKGLIIILGIVLPPIFLAALRYKVGIDYMAYFINYTGIAYDFTPEKIFTFYSKEPLYVIITYLGYKLFGSFTGVFYLYALIFVVIIFEALRYYKNRISITWGLFIFYMTYYLVFFNMMRQMIAVAIILYASRYLFEKKFWKYLLCVIVAGLFHKSAYVMILLYVLTFKLDSKKINKAFYILATGMPIIMIPALKLVIYLCGIIGIFERYNSITINLNFNFLLYVIPTILLIMIYRKKILEIDPKYEMFYRLVFLQLPAQFLGCFVNTADRMAVYLGVFQAILIPLILKTKTETISIKPVITKNKLKMLYIKTKEFVYKILNQRKYQKAIIAVWYVFYFIIIFTFMNSNGVYPYRTLFSFYTNS